MVDIIQKPKSEMTATKFTQTIGCFDEFTWKEECNYKAYLFIMFVMVNPQYFSSKNPLDLACRLSLCIL